MTIASRLSFAKVLARVAVLIFGLAGGLTSIAAFAQASPSAFTVAKRWDSNRQLVGEISPSASIGGTTAPFLAKRYTYDTANRLTMIEVGSLSSWQSEAVSPANWGSSFTVNTTTIITYDGLGRKLTERLVDSSSAAYSLTQYSYDAMDRIQCTAVRMNPAVYGSLPASACTLGPVGSQGQDRITRNVYDAAGQLLQVRRAVGTPLEQAYATYSYTPNGRQQYIIDANGNRTKLEYDGFDRQQRWVFPAPNLPGGFDPSTPATALATAGGLNAADYEEYGYDANGNRTSIRKRDGLTIAFTYDALNRVTVKTVPERAGLGSTHTRDVYYAYDLRGLMTAARFDGTSGEGVSAQFDGFGRLTTSTLTMDGGARSIGYLYDADGNRTRLAYPDSNYVTYGYDGLDRPTTILRSGTASIASYTYNSLGQRTGFNGAVTTSYGYDSAGRLNSLTNNLAASTYNNQWAFGFNPAGQITSSTRSNDAFAWTASVNVTRSYTPNGLNQYVAVGASAYCYDANGNLTADGASVYLYDVENRLVEKRVQGLGNGNCTALSYGGTLQAGLRYDPMGRLYEVVGSSGTTRMLYDGDALSAEYDTGGNLLRRYVHGADMTADDPIAWYEGSGFTSSSERIMRPDWQGSIVLVTDGSGSNVIGINRYDEYGIPQCPLVGGLPDCSAPGANIGRFQYTGQAWLSELGMYYYKARIYSPTLGRFLQTDPIGFDDQINLYAYVRDDSINHVDVDGKAGSCVDNGNGTKTCEITVTGSAVGILIFSAGVAVWNGGVSVYNKWENWHPKMPSILHQETNQEAADSDWGNVSDDAETGADGQQEKDGGKDQAEKDFDKLRGTEMGEGRANGARVKVLPDGTRAVLRPSTDGRWTLERQSPAGRKPDAGSVRRIRYNNS